MAQRRYFGTDGMRGRVGESPITPELVLKLGWAAGRVLARPTARARRPARRADRQGHAHLRLHARGGARGGAVGRRRRRLPVRAAADAGASPTSRARCGCPAGIVISASHNPFDDNGIKFFSARRRQAARRRRSARSSDAMEQPLDCVPSAELGKARRVERRRRPLHRVLQEHVPERARPARAEDRRRLRARRRLSRRAAGVPRARRRRDRRRRRAGRHSTSTPASARRIRRTSRSRCARTTPTSASRSTATATALVMVDQRRARCFDGDQLLYVIARDYQRRGALDGGVVGTLMSNLGFEQALARARHRARARAGRRPLRARAAASSSGWQLGGENSGHIICLDKHTTGDAIVAALAVLRALIEQKHDARRGRPRRVTLFPQRLINVPVRAASTGAATRRRARPSAPSSRRSATPAACCCGRRAPSPCCA